MFAVATEDIRKAFENVMAMSTDEGYLEDLQELLEDVMRHQVQVRE